MDLTRPSWPNGARCTVLLTFDNFGESFDLLRYGHAGGAVADGVYAPRRGVPRLLDLLDRHGIPGTFFGEGWNVRKYAALAREVAERGHELAAHGWMHESWDKLPRDVERDLIQRATEVVAEATGAAPRGWRAPSGLATPWTLEVLHELGYRYDSSFGDEDVPYWLGIAAGRTEEIVELPWQWVLDDAAYFAYPGALRRASDVIDLWIDEFDAAYRETGYFMLVCHSRYIGRPARAAQFERLIEHIKGHDGIWFARCDEVAEHVRCLSDQPRYPAPARLEW